MIDAQDVLNTASLDMQKRGDGVFIGRECRFCGCDLSAGQSHESACPHKDEIYQAITGKMSAANEPTATGNISSRLITRVAAAWAFLQSDQVKRAQEELNEAMELLN